MDAVRARYASAVAGRNAIVLVGPPASGKSTILRELTKADAADWMIVDADEVKDLLLEQALRDGSYDQIVPDEVKALEAAGERFFPRELPALVHAESVVIADALRQEAIAADVNLVIDGVLADRRDAEEIGAQLADAGYTIRVVQLEATETVSTEGMMRRWYGGYIDAIANGGGLGGRWVPPSYISTLYVAGGTRSRCYDAAGHLADVCGAVLALSRYEVPQPNHLRLFETWRRTEPGSALERI
jgi:predicted kinase